MEKSTYDIVQQPLVVSAKESKPQQKKRLSRKEQKARKKQRHQSTVQYQNPMQPATLQQAPIKQAEKKKENVLASYQPIPIPDSLQPSGASLGKWFPKAKVIKSSVAYSNDAQSTDTKASLVLFYQYVTPPWPESRVSQLLAYLTKIAETRKTLGGRIRVAPEGMNATVSSVDAGGVDAKTTLEHFCQDLKRFDKAFEETDFKFIDEQPADRHFKDLKLLPVKELVFYGFQDFQAPLDKGGVHLEPNDFHALLEGNPKDTVVVDVRNHYEAAIGRFDGGSAEYVDPKMRKSTDLQTWLSKPETQDKLKDKKVLMYCTGGVRCERASAYLNTQMGSQLKGVYQLKGGIERYLQEFPDGGHWRGKNFVFDKREAISADNRQGDGGVVRKQDKNKESAETRCCRCQKPWDRYIGKKKCHMCGVPVLMCDSCLSNKSSQQMVARCPLCVEDNITVPVTEVEYTKNGVAACAVSGTGNLKAAPSVLKWGGGHASKKKEKQRMKRKFCQFGADCGREDCFFAHPDREMSGDNSRQSQKP
jgi:predicted sulfurtransferase